jgi:hypothetical protein
MVDLQPEIEGAKVQNHVANFFSSKNSTFYGFSQWYVVHKSQA